MTALDVGAYVGQYSLLASRLVHESGAVIAVEPTPSVFAQLKRNIKLNQCRNVTAIHAAISATSGTGTLYFYSGSSDQNSLRPLDAECSASVEVTLMSLDQIVSESGLSRVDLIKIDVEGNELYALRGGAETIRRYRPCLVLEISRHQRTYGYTGAALKAVLDGFGYDVFKIDPEGLIPYVPVDDEINQGISHFNIIAVPSGVDLPVHGRSR